MSPLSATLCLLTRWIGRWLDSEPRSSQIQSLFDVWSSQGGGGVPWRHGLNKGRRRPLQLDLPTVTPHLALTFPSPLDKTRKAQAARPILVRFCSNCSAGRTHCPPRLT